MSNGYEIWMRYAAAVIEVAASNMSPEAKAATCRDLRLIYEHEILDPSSTIHLQAPNMKDFYQGIPFN